MKKAPAKQPGAFDGVYSSCVLTLRREISEPDEARAATVHDGNRPAETGRASRSVRRERLVPTGLHRLADRVRARRQTREQVVARGVGHRGRIDRTADRYAPALEAGPRRCVNEHLTIDRRGPTGRAGAYATAAGHWGRSRWRRQRRSRQRRRRVALWRGDHPRGVPPRRGGAGRRAPFFVLPRGGRGTPPAERG